jgi:hypothetical protein
MSSQMELGNGCHERFKFFPRNWSTRSSEVGESFPHIHNIMTHYIVVDTDSSDAFAQGQTKRTSEDVIRVCVSGKCLSIPVIISNGVEASPFPCCKVDGSTRKKERVTGTNYGPNTSFSEPRKFCPSSARCAVIVAGGILQKS